MIKMQIVRYCLVNNFLKSFQVGYATKVTKPEIPNNPWKQTYSANDQTDNGIVYDKKPFKITLHEGKTYAWCLCGRSKSQPLCDGTHKDVFLKITQRPIIFKIEKTKDYWLCNCKQTKNRPFCDGTHKNKEVVEATTDQVTWINLQEACCSWRKTENHCYRLYLSINGCIQAEIQNEKYSLKPD